MSSAPNRFRRSTNKMEIISIFVGFQQEKSPIMIWQMVENKRVLTQALLTTITPQAITLELIVTPGTTEAPMKINENCTLYLHGPSRNVLFKQNIVKVEGNSLTLDLPSEIRLHEFRGKPRFYFSPEDRKKIRIEIIDPRLKRPLLKIFLVWDISVGGVGLNIPPQEGYLFEKGKEVSIKFISNEVVPDDLSASIIYARPIVNKNKEIISYRVGLQFNKEIGPLSFHIEDETVEIGKTDTNAPKQNTGKKERKTGDQLWGKDRPSKFIGLSQQEQDDLVYQISLRDPKFSTIIKENLMYLEKLIYLTPVMKAQLFRENQMPRLAMALRMCTEDIIYHLFRDASSTLKSEFFHALKDPQSAQVVAKMQEELRSYLTKKEQTGQFIMQEDKDVLV